MGAWKQWQLGMIEDGASRTEIAAAEKRIKGTLADPLVRAMPTEFHAFTGESREAREHEWELRATHLVMQRFPGAEREAA